MNTIAALSDAAWYLDREGWCKGWSRYDGARCVLHALHDACVNDDAAYMRARHALERAVGIAPFGDIGGWNDAPERTFGDVMAALSRAITSLHEVPVPA